MRYSELIEGKMYQIDYKGDCREFVYMGFGIFFEILYDEFGNGHLDDKTQHFTETELKRFKDMNITWENR